MENERCLRCGDKIEGENNVDKKRFYCEECISYIFKIKDVKGGK